MDEIVVKDGWREWLEEMVARRSVRFVAGALAVVVLIAVLAPRSPEARIAPPASAPAPSAAASPTVVLVHVAGAVRRPGLYEFPEGARVADAVDSAKGPTARADLDAVNLAEVLVDGTRVYVPRRGEAAVESAIAGDGESAISINRADTTELEAVPGIGPVKAAAIVAFRDDNGSFTSLEQLLEVSGIGPATLETIRPHISL